KVDFSELKWTLAEAQLAADGSELAPAVVIGYGEFINTVIQFLIVAFAIFMLIKALNRLARKKAEAPAAPPAPSEEVLLLREIRDNPKK
ncbi:MAG: MscL family protein, partial [Stenotrophomonas koreensis]